MKTFAVATIVALASVATAQLSAVPQCALNCFIDPLTNDGCSDLQDFACHCKQADKLFASVTPCVQKACSTDDQGKTITAVENTCKDAGVPVSVPTPGASSGGASSGGASQTPAPSSGGGGASSAASSIAASVTSAVESAVSSALSSALGSATGGTGSNATATGGSGASGTPSASASQFTGAAAQATQAVGALGVAALALLAL